MAKKEPYVCSTCGKIAHDSEGIPVLTMKGVVNTYVVPNNWAYLQDRLICEECTAKRTADFEEEQAKDIASHTITWMEREYTADDFIMKRAAEIVYRHFGGGTMPVTDWKIKG